MNQWRKRDANRVEMLGCMAQPCKVKCVSNRQKQGINMSELDISVEVNGLTQFELEQLIQALKANLDGGKTY